LADQLDCRLLRNALVDAMSAYAKDKIPDAPSITCILELLPEASMLAQVTIDVFGHKWAPDVGEHSPTELAELPARVLARVLWLAKQNEIFAFKIGGARLLESFSVTNMCHFHEHEDEEEADRCPRKEKGLFDD